MPSADPSELAEVPLFASLSEIELAELATRLEVKEVGAGVRLIGEGATGTSFFVLREGEATVTVGGEEIATLAADDFFGEIALLGQGRRTATVTTTSPARVFVLFGSDLSDLEASFPAVVAEIEAKMETRLARG